MSGLVLTSGGQQIGGWTEIRVTRGIELLPSSFELSMTELYPDSDTEVTMIPGEACTIAIDGDLALTGYLDRYSIMTTPTSHTISASGRGKCQDLVDCSAEWPNDQISGTSAVDIATKLAAAYGISVVCNETGLQTIQQFNLNHTETAYEVIERVCRYSGLLVYDTPDGNLLLTRVGEVTAASGFTQGVNVQQANVEYAMDERFSQYLCYLQGVDTLNDLGSGGNVAFPPILDAGVKRNRKRAIIAESGNWENMTWQELTARRAQWECNRRIGRSVVVRVTADNWRDSAGTLWTPNTVAPVNLPAQRQAGGYMVLGTVTLKLSEEGRSAEIELMPPDAFAVEPIAPPGTDFDIQAAQS